MLSNTQFCEFCAIRSVCGENASRISNRVSQIAAFSDDEKRLLQLITVRKSREFQWAGSEDYCLGELFHSDLLISSSSFQVWRGEKALLWGPANTSPVQKSTLQDVRD